jgi:N-acetylneuraminic acid mutarotase
MKTSLRFTLLFFVTIIGLCPTIDACAQDGTWSMVAPLPTANQAAAAVGLDGRIYVVGGSDNSCGIYDSVNVYDPATNGWTAGAAMPTARAQVVAGAIDGKIYAATGFTACPGNPTGANEVYDPSTNAWTAKTSCPVARIAGTGAVIDNLFYVVGGDDSTQPLNRNDVYNAATDTWSMRAPIPTARENAGCAVLNGLLYVIGGQNNSGILQSVQAYDPITDAWTEKAPLPVPLGETPGMAATLNGRIYVCGGRLPGDQISSAVYVYDPGSDSWSQVSSLPTPRRLNATAGANGELYVVGGNQTSAASATAEVDRFTPFGPAPTPTPSPTASPTPTPPPAHAYTAQVQPPISADGTSVFGGKRGVVPAKFTLQDFGSPTCALPQATIVVTRTGGGAVGEVNESTYAMAADNGSNFRIDACQYIYNLNTAALGTGTYRIDIRIDDQTAGTAIFQVK